MSENIMNMQSSSVEMEFANRTKQGLSTEPILSARDVEVEFTLRGQKLKAIRRCSLDLYDGETLAIVGESGSGKSVFTKTFVGMLDKNGRVTGGNIMYDGKDLAKYTTESQWRTIRGKKIAMVTQDPMTSLNPLKTIGFQIQESVELHQGLKGRAAKEEVYRKQIREVGVYEPLPVREDALERFGAAWRQKGIGWFTEVVDDSFPGYKKVFAYYGTSVYNTEEFSRVLSAAVEDARALGIDVISPAERALMMEEWDAEHRTGA